MNSSVNGRCGRRGVPVSVAIVDIVSAFRTVSTKLFYAHRTRFEDGPADRYDQKLWIGRVKKATYPFV